MLIQKKEVCVESTNAGVAKLEDALALGASESNLMEVQVLSPAQTAWSPSSKATLCKRVIRGCDSHPGLKNER